MPFFCLWLLRIWQASFQFQRKSWIGVNSKVNLCKTLPQFNQQVLAKSMKSLNSLPLIPFNISINWQWFHLHAYTKQFWQRYPWRFSESLLQKAKYRYFQYVSYSRKSQWGNHHSHFKIPLSLDFYLTASHSTIMIETNFFYISDWNSLTAVKDLKKKKKTYFRSSTFF